MPGRTRWKRHTVADIPLALAEEDDRRMRFIFPRWPVMIAGLLGAALWTASFAGQLRAGTSPHVVAFFCLGIAAFLFVLMQYARRQAELIIDKVSGSVTYVNRTGASLTEWRKARTDFQHLLVSSGEDAALVMHLVPERGEGVDLGFSTFSFKRRSAQHDAELVARIAKAIQVRVFVENHGLRQRLGQAPGLQVEVRPDVF
jgi:hypothetical protein